jgi:hypothetical protein
MKLLIWDSDKDMIIVEVEKPIITQDDIDMYTQDVVDEHGLPPIIEIVE